MYIRACTCRPFLLRNRQCMVMNHWKLIMYTVINSRLSSCRHSYFGISRLEDGDRTCPETVRVLCFGTGSVSVFKPADSKTTVSVWWQSRVYYSVNSYHVMTAWRPRLNLLRNSVYEGCPESMQPFWISREPVTWPWCNLAASQRRPYCTSVNSHSPVGLVSRQWDTVDWACKLCDRRIPNDRASI